MVRSLETGISKPLNHAQSESRAEPTTGKTRKTTKNPQAQPRVG